LRRTGIGFLTKANLNPALIALSLKSLSLGRRHLKDVKRALSVVNIT
jgi:hypothetical protein